MAITQFQRTVCRLLAETRIASGESYVAGGVALNELPTDRGELCRDTRDDLARGAIRFHTGTIRGAVPRVR
jgi:hypothetical protein